MAGSGGRWSAPRAAASPPRSCSRDAGRDVTLTDIATDVRRGDALREAGVDARARRPPRRDARGRRSDRHESRACRSSSRCSTAARARGVEIIGELELASRWLRGRVDRDHRHEGQVHDDHAHRPDAEAGGPPRARWRQHRRAAECAGGRSRPRTRFTWLKPAAFSSRPPTTFRPWIALWLNFARRPPRSSSRRRGVRRRPRRASSRTRRPTTGQSSTPTTRW